MCCICSRPIPSPHSPPISTKLSFYVLCFLCNLRTCNVLIQPALCSDFSIAPSLFTRWCLVQFFVFNCFFSLLIAWAYSLSLISSDWWLTMMIVSIEYVSIPVQRASLNFFFLRDSVGTDRGLRGERPIRVCVPSVAISLELAEELRSE